MRLSSWMKCSASIFFLHAGAVAVAAAGGNAGLEYTAPASLANDSGVADILAAIFGHRVAITAAVAVAAIGRRARLKDLPLARLPSSKGILTVFSAGAGNLCDAVRSAQHCTFAAYRPCRLWVPQGRQDQNGEDGNGGSCNGIGTGSHCSRWTHTSSSFGSLAIERR